MNTLPFIILQLFLLVVSVYTAIFKCLRDNTRIKATDALLLLLQTANLTMVIEFSGGNYFLLLFVQAALIVLVLLRLSGHVRKVIAERRKLKIPQSIRQTIDYLPLGICFYTQNGRPVLTNRRMNELVFQLTGHTVINASRTWDDIKIINAAGGCRRLLEHQIPIDGMENTEDERVFIFPDKRIWRFCAKVLTEDFLRYTQLEATDITDLYRYSEELHENNIKLEEQYKRQQNLLANIVQINNEKEILTTKMRIHDDLGRSIITTKNQLSSSVLNENFSFLSDIWETTIRNLEDFAQLTASAKTSPEIELQRAADMIGCQIIFSGKRPTERRTMLLFYAAVREALTNAVRHAKARQLYVNITHSKNSCIVTITDNGVSVLSTILEGNGLSNLRSRIEGEGGTLSIKTKKGVALTIDIPYDFHKPPKQELVQ